MAGLRQGEGELNGLEVAHLAHQEDVGVLAECRPQGTLEGGAVGPDLSLRDGGEAVLVDVLDGVLDGQDVHRTRLVDAVDDRGQGGRLSGAGRAGQEHKAPGQTGEPFGHGRQPELLEGRDVGRDHAEGKSGLTLLGKRAATKTGPVQPAEREVHVLILFEGGFLLRREHGSDDLIDLVAGQDRRVIEHAQLAVDSHPWLRARCEQQVRALPVPEDLQPWGDRINVCAHLRFPSLVVLRWP